MARTVTDAAILLVLGYHAADLAPYERPVDARDGVIVLSHTGGTGYSMQMLERARQVPGMMMRMLFAMMDSDGDGLGDLAVARLDRLGELAELYEAKGISVLAEKAQAHLSELTG